MKTFNFKFVMGNGSKINTKVSGDSVGEALDKAVKAMQLENETFVLMITPLDTVFVPKGQYVDIVV